MVLSYKIKGYLTMFSLTRILTLAAVGALVALTATSIPVRADSWPRTQDHCAAAYSNHEAFRLGGERP
jgi:hypothetical protein